MLDGEGAFNITIGVPSLSDALIHWNAGVNDRSMLSTKASAVESPITPYLVDVLEMDREIFLFSVRPGFLPVDAKCA